MLSAVAAGAATGVLVEAPRRIVGIELFPATVVPYYRARYEVGGVDLVVYYTSAELPLPEDPDTVQCGQRVLQIVSNPDLEVRVLEHDGEALIYAWDTEESVDLCGFLSTFLDDFDFFRNAFPDDPGFWLPATVD